MSYRDEWEKAQITTMEEFERKLAEATLKLANMVALVKESQQAGEISSKIEQVSKSTQEASQALTNLMNQAKNLASDGEQSEKNDEPDGEDVGEDLYNEEKTARQELLSELSELARRAADEGDYKTAYKIERLQDVILFEEE